MQTQPQEPEPPRLGAKGVSTSSVNTKTRVLKVFDEDFRGSSQARRLKYVTTFMQLPAALVCDTVIYEEFSSYLLDEYVIPEGSRNNGDHIASNTFLKYLATLLRLAEELFKPGATDRRIITFFCCLDSTSTSDEARWYKGLKDNIERHCFLRAMKGSGGDSLDQSPGVWRPPPRAPHCSKADL